MTVHHARELHVMCKPPRQEHHSYRIRDNSKIDHSRLRSGLTNTAESCLPPRIFNARPEHIETHGIASAHISRFTAFRMDSLAEIYRLDSRYLADGYT